MKKMVITLVIILIISVFIGIFFQRKTTSPSMVKIGVIVDLTGVEATYSGEWARNGLQIAQEEIKGHGKSMKLLIEDSKGDVKAAVSALKKLIEIDKVEVVIACHGNSSGIMAMAPIAESKNILLFVTGASSPSISQAGDYIFRNRLSGDSEIEALAEVASIKFGAEKVGFVTLNNDAGHAYANYFKEAIGQLSIDIPVKIWINIGETDFRTPASKLANSKSKVVFYAGPVREGAMLMNACHEIGFNPQWLSISALRDEKLFEIAGSNAEGLVIATEFPDTTNPKFRLFNKKYYTSFGKYPNIYAVNAYDALLFLNIAIDSVGYRSTKIKEFLYIHEFNGAGGTIRFDKNGDAIRRVQLMQVKNGKFVMY